MASELKRVGSRREIGGHEQPFVKPRDLPGCQKHERLKHIKGMGVLFKFFWGPKIKILAWQMPYLTEAPTLNVSYMVRASLETVCLFIGHAKAYFFAIEHTYFRLFHYTELLLDQTARQLALPLERQQLWHCKLLVEFDLRQLGQQLF